MMLKKKGGERATDTAKEKRGSEGGRREKTERTRGTLRAGAARDIRRADRLLPRCARAATARRAPARLSRAASAWTQIAQAPRQPVEERPAGWAPRPGAST